MRYLKTMLYTAALSLTLGGCASTDEQGRRDVYDVKPAVVRPVDAKQVSVEFILDTSSSMNSKLNGERKIDSAKHALEGILTTYKAHNDKYHDVEAGVLYFSGFASVNQLVPLQPFDYDILSSKIRALNATSGTPLGASLAYAQRALNEHANGTRYIVLLTDGENMGGRDPEPVFAEIKKTNATTGNPPTALFVVAFNTNPEYFAGLQQEGAVLFDAKDAKQLVASLETTTSQILAEAPDENAVAPTDK